MIALAAPTKKQLTLLKKDIINVKATLKSGSDLDKSEATVRKYLSDTTYSDKQVELQQLLCEVLKKAYQVGNEKMYLKASPDTICLVKTGRRMFLAYQSMDSLDTKERKRNSQYLLPYRTNIFMGGLYFLHRKDWQDAWECFDLYLQCAKEPLFSECNITTDDELTHRVEFLSLVAAAHLDSLPLAMKYSQGSVLSNNREKALTRLSKITLAHKDSVDCERFLREGFKDYPTSVFFFPELVDLLTDGGRIDEVRDLCNEAVKVDSTNTMFLLAQHNILMDLKQYDEAIVVGDKIIAINDSIDTPYYNIGFIYHQRAMETLNAKGQTYRQRLAVAQKLFRRCKKYIERYRELRPYDRSHWRPILYDVYLNLNMGKEFAEVEK